MLDLFANNSRDSLQLFLQEIQCIRFVLRQVRILESQNSFPSSALGLKSPPLDSAVSQLIYRQRRQIRTIKVFVLFFS